MTRPEKMSWHDRIGEAERRPWVETLVKRLSKKPKRLARWQRRYREKCEKRGVVCPLDAITPPEGRRAG